MTLAVGRTIRKKIEDKTFIVKRLTPFLVSVDDGEKERLESIDGDVLVRVEKRFPDLPYLLRFKNPLTCAANTLLKAYLMAPLADALILSSQKREVVVFKALADERKAWFGEVYDGVLCEHVDAEISPGPLKGNLGNIPIRISNRNGENYSIKRFLLEPEYMTLFEGESGLFLNKVYLEITGEDEVKVSYTRSTSSKAGKTKVLVAQKKKPEKGIYLNFTPTVLAKHFGL